MSTSPTVVRVWADGGANTTRGVGGWAFVGGGLVRAGRVDLRGVTAMSTVIEAIALTRAIQAAEAFADAVWKRLQTPVHIEVFSDGKSILESLERRMPPPNGVPPDIWAELRRAATNDIMLRFAHRKDVFEQGYYRVHAAFTRCCVAQIPVNSCFGEPCLADPVANGTAVPAPEEGSPQA